MILEYENFQKLVIILLIITTDFPKVAFLSCAIATRDINDAEYMAYNKQIYDK